MSGLPPLTPVPGPAATAAARSGFRQEPLVGPHPTGGGVVGRYVHSYDPSRPQPYPSQIPAMRPPQEPQGGGPSATPIYDALYAEYQRSFRTLPGDRHGEEPVDLGGFADGRDGYGRHSGYGDRQDTSYPYTPWSGDGRVYGGGNRLPAALPPGPRRGL